MTKNRIIATTTMPIHMPGCFLNSSQPETIQSQPRPAATPRPPGTKLPWVAVAASATAALGAAYGFELMFSPFFLSV